MTMANTRGFLSAAHVLLVDRMQGKGTMPLSMLDFTGIKTYRTRGCNYNQKLTR